MTPRKTLLASALGVAALALAGAASAPGASTDAARRLHGEIVTKMRNILEQMSQWESFVDVVNQVAEVIKLEQKVLQETEKARETRTQEVFEDLCERPGIGDDLVDGGGDICGEVIAASAFQNLRPGAQQGQWCAEFVAGVGDEAALQGERLGQGADGAAGHQVGGGEGEQIRRDRRAGEQRDAGLLP